MSANVDTIPNCQTLLIINRIFFPPESRKQYKWTSRATLQSALLCTGGVLHWLDSRWRVVHHPSNILDIYLRVRNVSPVEDSPEEKPKLPPWRKSNSKPMCWLQSHLPSRTTFFETLKITDKFENSRFWCWPHFFLSYIIVFLLQSHLHFLWPFTFVSSLSNIVDTEPPVR